MGSLMFTERHPRHPQRARCLACLPCPVSEAELGSAADSVGLIDADLHPGSDLFWRDDVRVIDLDDCGFGYWLYDIAVALWELRHQHDYEQFRDALPGPQNPGGPAGHSEV